MDTSENLEFRELSLGVSAAGASERLLFRICGVEPAPGEVSWGRRLHCHAYFGDQQAFSTNSKHLLHRLNMDVLDGRAEATLEVQPWVPGCHGQPRPKQWLCRLKLFTRRKRNLLAQHVCVDGAFTVPRPQGPLVLPPGATVWAEVVRLAPAILRGVLEVSLKAELIAAVCDTAQGADLAVLQKLLEGAKELGRGKLPAEEAAAALEVASRLSKRSVVDLLLRWDAPVTEDAVRSADAHLPPPSASLTKTCSGLSKVGADEEQPLAMVLFERLRPNVPMPCWGSEPGCDLACALSLRLPRIAEKLFADKPSQLASLSADGGAAAAAHEAGAWTLLAALLARGDPPPQEISRLLVGALRAGQGDLARVCVALNGDSGRANFLEGLGEEIRPCIQSGCTPAITDMMRAEWHRRSKQCFSSSMLSVLAARRADANAEDLAECGICFELLAMAGAAVLRDGDGKRVCQHLLCSGCATDLITKALKNSIFEDNGRIEMAVCPFCRAPFADAAALLNPATDPIAFFQAASEEQIVGEPVLTLHRAAEALAVFLPVEVDVLSEQLQDHWSNWCGKSSSMTETGFLEQMWPWVSDNLLQLVTEEQRGSPPSLAEDPSAWFRHFDYDDTGSLTKPQVARGCAKCCDLDSLAGKSSLGSRRAAVLRVRNVVEECWDSKRWATAVPLADFAAPKGLAFQLSRRLPWPRAVRRGESL